MPLGIAQLKLGWFVLNPAFGYRAAAGFARCIQLLLLHLTAQHADAKPGAKTACFAVDDIMAKDRGARPAGHPLDTGLHTKYQCV